MNPSPENNPSNRSRQTNTGEAGGGALPSRIKSGTPARAPLRDNRPASYSASPPSLDWRNLHIVKSEANSKVEINSEDVPAAMITSLKKLSREVLGSEDRLWQHQDMPGSRTYPSWRPKEAVPELDIFQNNRQKLLGEIVTTTVVGCGAIGLASGLAVSGVLEHSFIGGALIRALPGVVGVGAWWIVIGSRSKVEQEFNSTVMKAFNMARNANTQWASMVAWNAVLYHLLETWNPLKVAPDRTDVLSESRDQSLSQAKEHIRGAAAYAFDQLEWQLKHGSTLPSHLNGEPDGANVQSHFKRLGMIEQHLASYKSRCMGMPDMIHVPLDIAALGATVWSFFNVASFFGKF